MKRCPYCAEKIQDAAIVCRYCGRDLPAVAEDDAIVTTKSVWRKALIPALVITALYVLEQFINPPLSQADLIYRLTLGLVATFIVFWLVCASIIGMWRKIGPLWTLAILCALGVLIWLTVQGSSGGFRSAPPLVDTPTSAPYTTETPDVAQTQTSQYLQTKAARLFSTPWGEAVPPSIPGCVLWKDIKRGDTCVYGAVAEFIFVEGMYNSDTNRYEPSFSQIAFEVNNPGRFLVTLPSPQENKWPSLRVGNCVVAYGSVLRDAGGTHLFMPATKLSNCPK